MNQKKDHLYRDTATSVKPFKFDENVAEVFDDMVRRSVPGYEQSIKLLDLTGRVFIQPGSNVYDLGCSLGTAILAIIKASAAAPCKYIAVDSSDAMLWHCRQLIDSEKQDADLEIICGDIREVKITNASIVILNYTLQFIPPTERKTLLQNIFNGLLPNGVLFLSEKIKMESDKEDQIMINLHEEFKLVMGYNKLEIAKKRAALDKVLIRETLSEHIKRLQDIGFEHILELSRCLNFITLLAVKK